MEFTAKNARFLFGILTSLQKLTAEAQRAQSFTLVYSLRPLRLGGEMTFLQ